MAFDRFSQRDFEDFLGVKPDGKPVEKGGFHRIPIPGINEVVYSKKVSHDLSMRVYSTIEMGFARDKDSDAIRVTIFWKPSDEEVALMVQDGVISNPAKDIPMMVGGEAKVLRVPTWRANLDAKLAAYEDIMPPRCRCGCPKVLKKPKKRKGQSWEPFWGCVLYKRCPIKTGTTSKPAPIVPAPHPKPDPASIQRPYRVSSSSPAPEIIRPVRVIAPTATKFRPTPAVAGPPRWNVLPEWQTIPMERRRADSKIPYNDPPY